MSEVAKLAETFKAEWTKFKAENDRALAEAAKNGGRLDPLTAEKIDRNNTAIGELQAQVDELTKKLQRPNMGAGPVVNEAQTKQKEAFAAFMRQKGLHAEAHSFQAAISVGSDPAGGYAVPETLDSVIEKYERDGSPMRQVCANMPLSNENYEKLTQEGSASVGWLGETEAPTETTTPTLRALKPYFGTVYAEPFTTQQALDDISNAEGWLSEEVGLAFAAEENAVFTTGSGIKKPKGLLSYTMSTSVDGTRTAGQIQKVHSASSGAFAADPLISLVHALHKGYRTGAQWMMSNLSVAAIRKLKDSTSGLYLFQPSFMAGAPATILGYPIVENEDVADPAADALAAVFGNFSRAYCIYDIKSLTVLRDPFTSKPYVKFYTTKRVGGMLVNDRAVKVMALST